MKRKIVKINFFDNVMNYYRIFKSEKLFRVMEDFVLDIDGWIYWIIIVSRVSFVYLYVNKIE